jgi:hypothetical protein
VSQDPSRPLVLLVHGIRDIARWQAEVAATLEKAGYTVEMTNYGRMNLIEFLLPISFFRKRALEIVWTQMQQATMLHPNVPISIIAHSFGTYIVANILKRQFNLSVDRVIFCGSVVRFDFPFEQINKRFNSPILNEVGTADPWPAVAESLTTGYGSAGTYGFIRPGVKDRYHNGACHGFFLNAHFCEKFWIPFLQNKDVPGDLPAEYPPLWVRLISIFKPKYFILTAVILSFLFASLRLLWGPDYSYSYDFNPSESKFVYWNAPLEQLRRDIVKPCWMPHLLCSSKYLTTLVTKREFKTFAIFDSQVRDIISCKGFRFPADKGKKTTNPNLALMALADAFSECVGVQSDASGSQVTLLAKINNTTPVPRPGKTTAFLCDCGALLVEEFKLQSQ